MKKKLHLRVTFRERDRKRLTAQSTHFAAFWRDQFGTLHATASGDINALDRLSPKAQKLLERAVGK